MYGLDVGSDNPGYFHAVYPIDVAAEMRLRQPNLVNWALLDPMAALNQRSVIESDLYEGVEAWDYQNPYVWQATQLQLHPTLAVSSYSLDTDASVQKNIAMSQGLIDK